MPLTLRPVIQRYIDTSNAHEVKSILACFTDDAVVRDESETHRGKIDIERWLKTTIEKYKFRFEPLKVEQREAEIMVNVEISGTFPGSPIALDYHFTIVDEKITSLVIDS
jgi:ketosteroid isomerase-like protein